MADHSTGVVLISLLILYKVVLWVMEYYTVYHAIVSWLSFICMLLCTTSYCQVILDIQRSTRPEVWTAGREDAAVTGDVFAFSRQDDISEHLVVIEVYHPTQQPLLLLRVCQWRHHACPAAREMS